MPFANAEILLQLERLEALQATVAKVKQLKAALEADPADKATRRKLSGVYLIELDNPGEAAKCLGDDDAPMRAKLQLAAGGVEKLSADQCRELAEWYRQVAAEPAGLAKLAMLERAAGYYQACLSKLDAPSEEVQTTLAALRGEMIDLQIRFGSKYLDLDLGGGVSMKMALIPAGKFTMGSPDSERDRRSSETQHEVTISSPFHMGVHEVTRGQFAAFVNVAGYRTDAEKMGTARIMGESGWEDGAGASWRQVGFPQTDDHPVVCVSWNDAAAFCTWLSARTGKTVRLPTEAEWEYACRAGAKTAFQWGDNPDDGAGWCNSADLTGRERFPDWGNVFNWADGYVFTAPAGSFKANAFGLYDIQGNVCEWCGDRYGAIGPEPAIDPAGPEVGTTRAIRRGAWLDRVPGSRIAFREGAAPDVRLSTLGFRVVLELKSPDKAATRPTQTAPAPPPAELDDGEPGF